jgi:hypothetical protein
MTRLREWWQKHRKAVIAVLGLVLTGAAAAAPADKWVAVAVAAATAAGVYRVPNEPGGGSRTSPPASRSPRR